MSKPALSYQERISGGLVGLLIGDALGVPYEFHSPDELPPADSLEFIPPPEFRRSHQGIPPGTWSDDGAQALCLLASLLEREQLDLSDFSERLVRWYTSGYLAVDGVVFDVGATTSEAIEALQSGTPPLKAGPARERDNGNGALMRVLPLALWHRGTDRELVKDAQLQSRVTHGHLRSQVCCALYCLWARRVLHGVEGAWSEAVATLRDLYLADPEALEELERSIQPEAPYRVTGSGYVVDCLHSARTAFEATSYLGVVRSAIALGNDTDTTACVAGGLAGLRHGIGGIPTRFREALRGSDIYEPLLQRLLEHVA